MHEHEYCIIGAGNIGILLSYFLRNEDVAIIKKNNSEITYVRLLNGEKSWEQRFVSFEIENKFFCRKALIATKAYNVEEVVSKIKGKAENVFSFQNGLGIIEILVNNFGVKNSFGSSITYGVSSCGKYCTEIKGLGEIIVGQLGKKYDENVLSEFSYAIKKGGGNIEVVDDIMPYLWLKAIINSAINPITALLGSKNKAVIENDFAQSLALKTIKEGEKVASALGIKLPSDPEKMLFEIATKTGENYSSMLQDIKNKKRTEIDYINGYIALQGEKLSLNMETNKTLYLMVKALEKELFIT
ncbi:MAG: ketopantoate reductase family protein [Fervidicoccus fontis]